MAEVFGVVVSAFTVAEMAGKFGASIVKLKKLWDEVQDVPNEINQLVRQLELLRPVLSEMEAEFVHPRHKVYHDSAANLSMEYCQQAVGELDALAEDLQTRITTAKRFKRNITKLKVSFKKDLIRSFQERIQFALQLLSLSQQTYIIAVIKSRPLDPPGKCSHQGLVQQTELVSTGQSETITEKPRNQHYVTPADSRERKIKPLSWHKASFFGSFAYQTVPHPKCSNIEVHQARVQLPWWISERVFDLQAYRACTGWKISLGPWITRPLGAPIFEYVDRNMWSETARALEQNEASLLDRDPQGNTLLHRAAYWGQLDTMKKLINMGLSLDGTNHFGLAPLDYLCLADQGSGSVLDILQHLIDAGDLDDHIEELFSLGNTNMRSSLAMYTWNFPGVLEIVVRRGQVPYYQLEPEVRFGCLHWYYIDPKILLDDIRRGCDLYPVVFRAVLSRSGDSSLNTFAMSYFRNVPDLHKDRHTLLYRCRIEETEWQNSWRELARRIFRVISSKELNEEKRRKHWRVDLTPLFAGLVAMELRLRWCQHKRRHEQFYLSRVLFMWLEDVQSSGVDLAEYGRCELEQYTRNDSLRLRRWFGGEHLGEERFSLPDLRLTSFTYGPQPQDWKLIWDLEAEEYAGEFWEHIENPPLHVPGEWVDDDDDDDDDYW
ncbi:hypothetical protein EsH8_II_001132 [Colletotrichum jinshuiense]